MSATNTLDIKKGDIIPYGGTVFRLTRKLKHRMTLTIINKPMPMTKDFLVGVENVLYACVPFTITAKTEKCLFCSLGKDWEIK